MEIRLEKVSKSYPGLALGPVSLVVPSGTLMVLEGANGSGKTTLLELIAGTVEPDGGKILLGGRDAGELAPSDRGVFYIPQTLHKFWSLQHESRLCFIPRRTVRENLLAAAADYGEAQEWLCRLDLEDYAEETPERLSFGLQQRLALARAAMLRPGVILVDEGLSALDPGMRSEVFELLERIPERTGNTVVYVTHHAEDAGRLGGTMHRLRDGNLFRPRDGERGAAEKKARLLAAVRAKVRENLDAFRPTHPGGVAEYGEESVDFLSAQLTLGDSSPEFRRNLARWLGVERALLEGGAEGIRRKLLGANARS